MSLQLHRVDSWGSTQLFSLLYPDYFFRFPFPTEPGLLFPPPFATSNPFPRIDPHEQKEHLLLSEVLAIFRTSYYFCACSDLSLLYEAYDFSSHSEIGRLPACLSTVARESVGGRLLACISQVLVYISLFLEIHR